MRENFGREGEKKIVVRVNGLTWGIYRCGMTESGQEKGGFSIHIRLGLCFLRN